MWPSALDQTMLDMNKVLLFIKSVDSCDRENVCLILETYDGLTTDWAMVNKVCIHFDKQREWNDKGSSSTGLTTMGIAGNVPTRSEETRRWLESGRVLANVVNGPSGGAMLEELTKMRLGRMVAVNHVTGACPMTLGAYGATVLATFGEIPLTSLRC